MSNEELLRAYVMAVSFGDSDAAIESLRKDILERMAKGHIPDMGVVDLDRSRF